MGVWAMLVPWVWIWPGLIDDPVFWHAHELIFGMAGAALGGYLLIALPSWTGPKIRHRIGRLSLLVLVLAWGLGRGALLFGAQGPAVSISASLYPLWLSAVLLPPLWRARAWQKLPFAVVPMVLAAADLTWLEMRQSGVSDLPFGLMGVLIFAVMLSMVGGRAVPAFINSRFCGAGDSVSPLPFLGALASVLIVLSIIFLVAQNAAISGAAMMAAAALQAFRLFAWGRRGLFAHLDLMMLYLAWAWLVIGLALLGGALQMPDVYAPATLLHGLTIGAMGSMIMAITSRAFMARAPGRLLASPTQVAAFVLIGIAAILRLLLPYTDVVGLSGVQWSVGAWSLGWALFLRPVLRGLTKPPPHPVLSALRR